MNITGPIKFGNNEYLLSWSSHPAANFYKQEYLIKGDNPDKFQQMLMIDFVITANKVKDVITAKVTELEELKKKNPAVQYEVFENNEEFMLDFLVTQNSADGKKVEIVERNVYRYKYIREKSGKSGVLMFGVSTRSYGNDITTFFEKLKGDRFDVINALGQFQIPQVAVLE
ncbi:MAG: hypothetical protein V4619_09880 [Bacteroidota bacterium]